MKQLKKHNDHDSDGEGTSTGTDDDGSSGSDAGFSDDDDGVRLDRGWKVRRGPSPGHRRSKSPSFRGWVAPKEQQRSELAVLVAVTLLGLTGLLFGGYGLWALSHPFGTATDMSELGKGLEIIVPKSLSKTLQETYGVAKVRWAGQRAAGGPLPSGLFHCWRQLWRAC